MSTHIEGSTQAGEIWVALAAAAAIHLPTQFLLPAKMAADPCAGILVYLAMPLRMSCIHLEGVYGKQASSQAKS